jgi:hypothetical protein
MASTTDQDDFDDLLLSLLLNPNVFYMDGVDTPLEGPEKNLRCCENNAEFAHSIAKNDQLEPTNKASTSQYHYLDITSNDHNTGECNIHCRPPPKMYVPGACQLQRAGFESTSHWRREYNILVGMELHAERMHHLGTQ